MNELQTFSNGDTNYIQKHNANNANLKAAIEALENNLAAQVAAASGPGSAFDALFGPTAAIIGGDSYAMTGSGDVLSVAPGFNWKPSIPMVVRNPAPTTMSFTGLAAATYYIYADKTGAPVRNATAGVEDLYSVVWTGSAFGDITRLAPIVWGAGDDFAAQVSTALGQTFTKLDDRLEAGEAAAAAGALARAWQIGRLSKDVSGGDDITLSATEANNTVMNLTGVLTANINVIVPVGAGPRLWVVTNNTTGAYTVTIKAAFGAGVVAPQGDVDLLSQDGTNVFSLLGGDGSAYLTEADADALYDALGAASSAVTAHAGATDPHPQYLTQAEGDARYAASAAATGGTVTSVALTTPGLLFDVSGSPVTGAGTLAMSLKTQAKNTFLAGPASGADAAPTMRALTQADLPAQPFDLTAFYPGVPPASVKVTRVPFARAVTFPANFAGSIGIASVAATASTVFDVRKNGSSIGSITFAAGATTATFSTTGAVSLAAGDYLSIWTPSTPDATLADPGFVLAGSR